MLCDKSIPIDAFILIEFDKYYIDYLALDTSITFHPESRTQTELYDFINNKIDFNEIANFALIQDFGEYLELYSFCTPSNKRKKGFGSKTLDFVKNLSSFTKKKIWLGVLDNQPNNLTVKLTNYYIKNGFSRPKIGSRKISGFDTNKEIISLTYSHNDIITQNIIQENMKQFELLYKFYKQIVHKTNIIFDKTNADKLKNLLTNYPDKEIGGVFRPIEINDGIKLEFIEQSLVEGYFDPTNKDAVHAVNNIAGNLCRYSFHTHPRTCYNYFNTCIGFPSGQDITMSLIYFKNSEMYIVISEEGIYLTKLSPMFLEVYKNINHEFKKDLIIKIVKKYFDNIENLRSKNFHILKQKYEKEIILFDRDKAYIEKFLNIINSVTLNIIEYELIKNDTLDFGVDNLCTKIEGFNDYYLDSKNINIFQCQFLSWTEIDSNNMAKFTFLSHNNDIYDDTDCTNYLNQNNIKY